MNELLEMWLEDEIISEEELDEWLDTNIMTEEELDEYERWLISRGEL